MFTERPENTLSMLSSEEKSEEIKRILNKNDIKFYFLVNNINISIIVTVNDKIQKGK